MTFRRVTVVLSVAIIVVAVFANWPREVSSTKRGIEQAGLPKVFAIWRDGRLESFSMSALLIDIAVPAAGLIALLAASIQRGQTSQPTR